MPVQRLTPPPCAMRSRVTGRSAVSSSRTCCTSMPRSARARASAAMRPSLVSSTARAGGSPPRISTSICTLRRVRSPAEGGVAARIASAQSGASVEAVARSW